MILTGTTAICRPVYIGSAFRRWRNMTDLGATRDGLSWPRADLRLLARNAAMRTSTLDSVDPQRTRPREVGTARMITVPAAAQKQAG
jgi:hypothetical protein